MTYFFDASFLTALFIADDIFHQKAISIIRTLNKKDPQYLTSDIALSETTNLTFRIKGAATTKKFLSWFPKSNIQLLYLNQEIFQSGYKILLAQKSRNGLNFFDCLHLATMKELGVENILTFDNDFKKFAKINEAG